MRIFLGVLVLCSSVGCGRGAPRDSGDRTAIIPVVPADQPGLRAVGVDEDRVQSSSGLSLPLQIWYPTYETGGVTYAYPLAPDLGVGQVNAVPSCPSKLPVVMFSHGNGGLRYQSVFLMEHLASHGYLVAAPDHVGNTTFDLDSIPRHEVAARRPLDIVESFEHLASRAGNSLDPLFGCVDSDDGYVIIGHSFGGWTTLVLAGAAVQLDALTEACPSEEVWLCGLQTAWTAESATGLRDYRIKGAVALTPVGAFSLGEGLSQIYVPTLIIGGLLDTVTKWDLEAEPIFAALTAPERAIAGLEKTGHYGFSDFCLDLLSPNCGPDSLALDEVHRITNGLTLSWLRMLRGEEGVALPPEDPEVTVWQWL